MSTMPAWLSFVVERFGPAPAGFLMPAQMLSSLGSLPVLAHCHLASAMPFA